MRIVLGTVVSLATVATLLVGGPAVAEVDRVQDRTGDGLGRDGRNGDLASMRVRHGRGAVSFVVRPAQPEAAAHYYDFWLDTDRRSAGPEYVATVSIEVDRRVSVTRIDDGFGDLTGTRTCERLGTRYDFDTAVLRTRFPRWCLGRPRQLRVSLQASQEYGTTDWVPGRRAYSRWLSRG